MSNSLMVGYLESWASPGITFTQAVRNGYDAIVMAFGSIEGSQVSIYRGSFVPSGSNIKQDISDAKVAGAKQILCSFGGGNNTYEPGDTSPTDLAESIVLFLQTYGFTGVDFDLEIDTSAEHLDELCAAIKKKDSSLIITAAPQINQDSHDSNLLLVSTATAQIYQQALSNKRFDYLFVQGYNNPWPKLNGLSETDVGFISESFKNLKLSVPAETLIAIGEPATKISAGTSIFTVDDVPADIYQQIADQYASIKSDPQFGGAMVWNINQDADNGDQFVKHVGAVVKGS
jgi:chitinase